MNGISRAGRRINVSKPSTLGVADNRMQRHNAAEAKKEQMQPLKASSAKRPGVSHQGKLVEVWRIPANHGSSNRICSVGSCMRHR